MNAPFAIARQGARLADLSDPGERVRIEAFVANHPDGTLFHCPAWLEAVARGTGNPPLALIAERGARITAYLPLSADPVLRSSFAAGFCPKAAPAGQ